MDESLHFETMMCLVLKRKHSVAMDQLSWLEALYVQGLQSCYPQMFKKHFESKDERLTLLTSVQFNTSRLHDYLNINDHRCRTSMNRYADTIVSALGSEYKLPEATCIQGDMYTWAVDTMDRTYYPEPFVHSRDKWLNWFPGSQTWAEITPEYHFYWRNILIPTHEAVHRLTLHRHGSLNQTSDANPEYWSEWQASALNLCFFLMDCEHRIAKQTCPMTRNKTRLFAITGVLYCHALLRAIEKEVGATNPMINVHRKWAGLEHHDRMLTRTDVWRACTGQKHSWENTYAKHVVALLHATNCFEASDHIAFCHRVLSSYFRQYLPYYSNRIVTMDQWGASEAPRPVAQWLKMESPALQRGGSTDNHVYHRLFRSLRQNVRLGIKK